MTTHFMSLVRDDQETEVEVEYTISRFVPAQTYGPAENCYPGEGGEVEIIDCWLLADANRADAPRVVLTDAEENRMCLEIFERHDFDDDDGGDW